MLGLGAFDPSFFDTSVTLTAAPTTTGAQGGANPAPAGDPKILSAYAELKSQTVEERQAAGNATRRVTVTEWWLFFPSDPGVSRGDSLTFRGHTAAALGVAEDDAFQGVLYLVRCQEVRG